MGRYLRRVAFDIETGPDPDLVARMAEPQVAIGNLKDPEKIAEKIAEARQKQLSLAALDPHCSRILAITVARLESNGDVDVQSVVRLRPDMLEPDMSEIELLRWFWGQIVGYDQQITYNGCQFDVPYILRRCALLGVRPHYIPIHKYRAAEPTNDHFDIYQFMDQHGRPGRAIPRSFSTSSSSFLGLEPRVRRGSAKRASSAGSGSKGRTPWSRACAPGMPR